MVQKTCVLGNTSGPPAWGPFWPISLTHKEFRRHLGHLAAPRLLPAPEPCRLDAPRKPEGVSEQRLTRSADNSAPIRFPSVRKPV